MCAVEQKLLHSKRLVLALHNLHNKYGIRYVHCVVFKRRYVYTHMGVDNELVGSGSV